MFGLSNPKRLAAENNGFNLLLSNFSKYTVEIVWSGNMEKMQLDPERSRRILCACHSFSPFQTVFGAG